VTNSCSSCWGKWKEPRNRNRTKTKTKQKLKQKRKQRQKQKQQQKQNQNGNKQLLTNGKMEAIVAYTCVLNYICVCAGVCGKKARQSKQRRAEGVTRGGEKWSNIWRCPVRLQKHQHLICLLNLLLHH